MVYPELVLISSTVTESGPIKEQLRISQVAVLEVEVKRKIVTAFMAAGYWKALQIGEFFFVSVCFGSKELHIFHTYQLESSGLSMNKVMWRAYPDLAAVETEVTCSEVPIVFQQLFFKSG
jgi:hypothetical protein